MQNHVRLRLKNEKVTDDLRLTNDKILKVRRLCPVSGCLISLSMFNDEFNITVIEEGSGHLSMKRQKQTLDIQGRRSFADI